MEENQKIEKLLEKMTQLLKEIEKLRQSRESAEIPKQSGKTTVLGNFVNLAQTEEGISSRDSYIKWNLFKLDSRFGSIGTCHG